MKPACSYLRVSGQSQSDGDGFPRQAESIERFADGRYHVLNCFYEAISGTKDSIDRPGFTALLDYCAAHNVRVILIEKMDRWARDLIVGEILLAKCRELGLDVIDCATGQNLTEVSDDPYVKFVRQVMLAAAELNKNIVVSQTAKARRRIRESGRKCDGRKGYRDFPEWKPVVERIESLAGRGLNHEAIAQRLNQEGVETLKGGPWKRGTIHRILKGAA